MSDPVRPKGPDQPPQVRGKQPIREGAKGVQVPSSGSRLPGFVQSFLNFVWPVFGRWSGEATFTDWRAKKSLINALSSQIEEKSFKALLETYNIEKLTRLTNLLEDPQTTDFLKAHYQNTLSDILSLDNTSLEQLKEYLKNPKETEVPNIVFKTQLSSSLYKSLMTNILKKFENPREVRDFLDSIPRKDIQALALSDLLKDIPFTNKIMTRGFTSEDIHVVFLQNNRWVLEEDNPKLIISYLRQFPEKVKLIKENAELRNRIFSLLNRAEFRDLDQAVRFGAVVLEQDNSSLDSLEKFSPHIFPILMQAMTKTFEIMKRAIENNENEISVPLQTPIPTKNKSFTIYTTMNMNKIGEDQYSFSLPDEDIQPFTVQFEGTPTGRQIERAIFEARLAWFKEGA